MQKYDRLGKIGEGTHGAVFKAKCRETKEIVALKPFCLDENIGIPTSALREICMLKQLCHPNVIRLLDLLYDTTNKCTSNDNTTIITLVYEYCSQDLKHYCDSIASSGKGIETSIVRLVMVKYTNTNDNHLSNRLWSSSF